MTKWGEVSRTNSVWTSVWKDGRLFDDRMADGRTHNPIPKDVRHRLVGALGAVDVLIDALLEGRIQMARWHMRTLARIFEELPPQIEAIAPPETPDVRVEGKAPARPMAFRKRKTDA